MKITAWKYRTQDISTLSPEVKEPNLTLVANGANAAIYDLIKVLKPGHTVLDIGCGSFSYLKNHLPDFTTWQGIDVVEIDSRGRKTIATKLGSVHAIPFQSGSFDFVMCNQSIEHWHEYNVDMADGLKEISRVLKSGGRLHINFPLYLHGHPWFVTGDMEAILSIWDKSDWEIEDVVGYEDWSVENYHGWEHCNFPYFYVSKFGNVFSSFTCSIVARKVSNVQRKQTDATGHVPLKLCKRKSLLGRALIHGLCVTSWKAFNKVFKN
jgi:SAM-dependent methyltransferase